MSKLRTNKWKCQNWLGLNKDGGNLGLCGETATYRCNACRNYFCDECWIDHLEMSAVLVDGKVSNQQRNMHGGR